MSLALLWLKCVCQEQCWGVCQLSVCACVYVWVCVCVWVCIQVFVARLSQTGENCENRTKYKVEIGQCFAKGFTDRFTDTENKLCKYYGLAVS